MPEASVQVELAANVGRLRTDLVAATSEVQNFAKGVSRDVAGAMAPANEAMRTAEGVHRGFLGTLREFRSEQIQQGRQARFLAGEIASIIPSTSGARSGLEGFLGVLIEGAAGGLSFGLALESVKLGMGLLTTWMEERSKRAAEVLAATRKMGDESFQSVISLGRQIDAINGTPLSSTQEAIRKATDEANQELTKQRRIVADMQREGRNAATSLGDPTTNWLGQESKAFRQAKEDLLAMEQGYWKRLREIRERGESEEPERNRAQLKAIEVERLQHEATQATGVAAIRKKLEADLKALDLERDLTDNARETKRIHLEQWADEELLKLRRKYVAEAAQIEVEAFTAAELGMVQKGGPKVEEPAWLTGMRKGELVPQGGSAMAEAWTGMELGNTSADEAARAAAAYTDSVQRMQEASAVLHTTLSPVTAGFQSLFSEIVEGGKLSARSFENFGKGIIKSFGNMMIQLGMQRLANAILAHLLEKPVKIAEVTAQSGVVGAGTAAALASNPLTAAAAIPGGLAAAQAAMASFIPIASAAGGFDIPAGMNPITQLHQREMVLPADIADQLRGGGGGTTVHLTINALDGKSVERVFSDNATPILRTFDRWSREGRFA